MIGVGANIPEFAVHWVTQLGANPLSVELLRGGINNRVFRCGHRFQQWVIKGYAHAQPGQRDRMLAEVEFLRFAAQVAPGFTPVLIEVDPERRCLVLENLNGQAFPEGVPPSNTVVAEAVEFFRQLNSQPLLARDSINLDAAEGFLSLREHLINVRERIDGMSIGHLEHEIRPQAKTLLGQLQRELERIEDHTMKMIDQGLMSDAIDPAMRCVSPSDFGFHNAIRTSKRTKFIDFEFAGWDDPAKAVIDFIYQPRIRVSGQFSPLIKAIHPSQRKSVVLRCHTLKPVLRIKWLCIMLSVLRPERLDQIVLVSSETDKVSFIKKRIQAAADEMKGIKGC